MNLRMPISIRLLAPAEEADEENNLYLKPLGWAVIKRLFGYTRTTREKVIGLVLLTLVRSMQIPALVWIAARVIAGPVANHNYRGVVFGSILYLSLAVATETMFHFRQRYALEVGEIAISRIRSDIARALIRQPISFYNRTKLGVILSSFTSDLDLVRTGIQDVGFMAVVQIGQMAFAATIMACCDWRLFLVLAAVAPVLWGINVHFRMRFSRLSRESQRSFGDVTAAIAESVNGIRVTQAFSRQKKNVGLFRRTLIQHASSNTELARTAGKMTPLIELNGQLFVSLLLLIGGFRLSHGTLPIENLILFFFMANQFLSPITTISALYSQALMAMAGAERIFALLDTKPDWTDSADARDFVLTENAQGIRVEFRSVTFGYEPEQPILHELNLVAEKGQMVALVGHTGSGKTSVVNLIAKFYLPTSGNILFDGQDIRALTSDSIHQALGLVQQQNVLFSGTVADNIRLGRPFATDAEIRCAVAQLGFLDVIEALPAGLQTQVGENGNTLSIGQRQLVCIARAFLPNPKLIILDEATSALDALTDMRVQQALSVLLHGRTSFVVAHRLSTIRNADLVLVLQEGRIVERGKHAELVRANGRYASLHRQFLPIETLP